MNKLQKILILITCSGLVIFCTLQHFQICELKKNNASLKTFLHTVPFDSLKRQIVNHGDSQCYESLKVEYMDIDAIENLLPWSLIMANKYNYRPAYFDVYMAIQGIISIMEL